MEKLAITMGAIAFLTIPALAASAPSDKPLVVAEDTGVSVHLGDKDRRDRDHHHVVVIHKHHDEEHHHHVVVVHKDYHDDDNH